MRSGLFFRRLSAGVVIAAAAGGSVLLGGVANAAPPAGTLGGLSFDPPTGTNLTVGSAITNGPCNTGGDSALLDVVGPADSPFPPGNPYNITTTESTDYSQTVPFGVSLQTAATDRGKPLTAGEYDFTVHCITGFGGQEFGTFTGVEIFDTPTTYHSTGSSPPPSSSSPSPSQSPSLSETPTPTSTPTDSPLPTPSDSATTTPTTSPSDVAGATTSPDPGGGTQPVASTGRLASTGAPIAGMFLGGLILLAAGLALVVWLKRPRRRS
ncbi:MAG: hypothetical protein ACRDQU_13610 [Pseudonocardiaceae bacterium]